jgi:hypothetical protein
VITGLTDLQNDLLAAMRGPDPLDYFMLAATVGEAPFRVRAELKNLRRERLVHEMLAPGRIVWVLTARGIRLAWGLDQQELTS